MVMDTEQNFTTIHVFLLDEGIEVWRPVKAVKLKDNTYLILSNQTVPRDEIWEFQPGNTVVVEQKLFQSGGLHEIAVKKAV
jgi:hypothetical protein